MPAVREMNRGETGVFTARQTPTARASNVLMGLGHVVGCGSHSFNSKIPLRLRNREGRLEENEMLGSLGMVIALIISALGMLKQEDHCKSEASQGKTVSKNK